MAVSFGIVDALIALRNATDDYEDGIDVPFIQMMGASLRTLSAEGNGDNKIAVVASVPIAGQVQVRVLGAPFAVIALITGATPIVTGSGSTVVTTLPLVGGVNYPHFAVVGKGQAAQGTGDQLIFAPDLVITSDVTLMSMEYGALNNLEFTAMAVDDETYGILRLLERATTGGIALPPAGMA